MPSARFLLKYACASDRKVKLPSDGSFKSLPSAKPRYRTITVSSDIYVGLDGRWISRPLA